MTFGVAAISSFLNNQTFRSNYNNGYGIQAAVRILPATNLFAEANLGFAYHGFTSSNPLGETGFDYGSLNKLFGGITTGYQQNINHSADFYVGAGLQISSYQLDALFDTENAQGLNSFYGEAGVHLGMLGIMLRYGLANNNGRQSLIEYGIRLNF